MEIFVLIFSIIGSFASIYALFQVLRDLINKSEKKKAVLDIFVFVVVAVLTIIFVIIFNPNNKQNNPKRDIDSTVDETIEYFQKDDIVETVNCHEMLLVDGGEFLMGCLKGRDGKCEDNEKPVHLVSINPFMISKYEVTNQQYVNFLNAKGNQIAGGWPWLNIENEFCRIIEKDEIYTVLEGYENHPVIEISWNGANAYCNWLSEQSLGELTFRLPSESEWEFAARGGVDSKGYTYSGSNNQWDVATFLGEGNSIEDTNPVGQSRSNEIGIFDMTGNVSEWVADNYCDNYDNAPKDGSAVSHYCEGYRFMRIARGGSTVWSYSDRRVAMRNAVRNIQGDFSIGFRIVSSIDRRFENYLKKRRNIRGAHYTSDYKHKNCEL